MNKYILLFITLCIFIILVLIWLYVTYQKEFFYTKESKPKHNNNKKFNTFIRELLSIKKKNGHIPKIIHQIWMDKENELNDSPLLPEKYLFLSSSWKERNKDYHYVLWNGYFMDKFVQEYYKEYYSLYKNLVKWIYRCDFFRYILLHYFGGIYIDIDFVCCKSLPKWTHKIILFTDCKPDMVFCGINNCLLISEPNNPFWLKVLSKIQENFILNPHMDVVHLTGPHLLNDIPKTSDVYIETNHCLFFSYHYQDRDNQSPPNIQECTIGYHLWDFSWKDQSVYYQHPLNIDTNHYDIIIIGGGLFGLLFAQLIFEKKRVLILEAGGIELTQHIHFYQHNFNSNMTGSFWKLPHTPIYLQETQTTFPYALGGRSPYWGGWVTIPSENELKQCDEKFIQTYKNYQKEARRVLHLHEYDPPHWIHDPTMEKANKSLLDNYPMCLVNTILRNDKIKLITQCKVLRLLYSTQNTKIEGLMTTKGYLDVRNNLVILSCGTYEIANLLLNKDYQSDIMDQIGSTIADHIFTRVHLRFSTTHTISMNPFLLKPFHYCYIQVEFTGKDEHYYYLMIDAFVSVTIDKKKFLSNNQKISNLDGSYKINIHYLLNKNDLKRWDQVDEFVYHFMETYFPNYEYLYNDEYIFKPFRSEEERKIFFTSFRQPLLSSYHESSTTPYRKVVDINSQVYDTSNLFIIGPSVLPIIEGNNPTLLSTCMLLRLRDYLCSFSIYPKIFLYPIQLTQNHPWRVLETQGSHHQYRWNNDQLILEYSGDNWGLLWLDEPLPLHYKITCHVQLEKGNNSGIFIHFSNPSLYPAHDILSFLVNDGLEIQLLNEYNDDKDQLGEILPSSKIVPYLSKISIKTHLFVEIIKKDHFIIVYINGKLITYSPFTEIDTCHKYLGFQWHEGGTETVIFSNIQLTTL